jgi:N-acyl-phosphatidylethanolamine-hydrolysing phospholipase D
MNAKKFWNADGFKSLALVISLAAVVTGCAAVRSTGSAIGRNTAAFFGSTDTIPGRMDNPRRADAGLSVLWIGHATVLIQIDGKFILTDPVFTRTVGLFSRRLVEPGLAPDALPECDVVLISHMHIDHLSPLSLEMIEPKVGQLIVPPQGLVYVPNFNFPMRELQAWESWERDSLRITAVPVLHNGWRYGIDGAWMRKSYTGYVIEYHGRTVYFGGDTGYDSTLFAETRKRFPHIDLALLPIAPMRPHEYTRVRHLDPPDALNAWSELGATWMVPMHYETFTESLDNPGEALQVLRNEMTRRGVDTEAIVILKIGEQRLLVRK